MQHLEQKVHSSYVLDGEFYTSYGTSTYFIFDVYCKNQDHTLLLTLENRLAMLDEELSLAVVVTS